VADLAHDGAMQTRLVRRIRPRLRSVVVTWGGEPLLAREALHGSDVADVVDGLDVPVTADPSGELGGSSLGDGQAGDGVDGEGPPFLLAR
jgi:hypothetical protein